MLKINDRQGAVRRIQRYLRFINDRFSNNITNVSIDGIYGAETRLAVMRFQTMRGIEASGIVDVVTNEELYKMYQKAIESEIKSEFSNNDFPILFGSNSRAVKSLNNILRDLSVTYKEIPASDRGSYFGYNTKIAVEAFEEIIGRQPSGIVDSELYNRMLRETKVI